MEKGYYISRPGKERKGPYALEQLHSMWTSGTITADTIAEDESGNRVSVAAIVKKIQDKKAIDDALKGCSSVNGCFGCLGLIIFGFLALWVANLFFKEPPLPPKTQDQIIAEKKAADFEMLKADLVVKAHSYCKKHLKSPSTATFPGMFEMAEERVLTNPKTGKYALKGWVDSQNSFGATIRTRYMVYFDKINGEQVPIKIEFADSN